MAPKWFLDALNDDQRAEQTGVETDDEARSEMHVPPYGSAGDDDISVFNDTPSHLVIVVESGPSQTHITVRFANVRRELPHVDGICDICGKPMPQGEEMFRFHGMSGPCPGQPF